MIRVSQGPVKRIFPSSVSDSRWPAGKPSTRIMLWCVAMCYTKQLLSLCPSSHVNTHPRTAAASHPSSITEASTVLSSTWRGSGLASSQEDSALISIYHISEKRVETLPLRQYPLLLTLYVLLCIQRGQGGDRYPYFHRDLAVI
jgi:hypothetical protein